MSIIQHLFKVCRMAQSYATIAWHDMGWDGMSYDIVGYIVMQLGMVWCCTSVCDGLMGWFGFDGKDGIDFSVTACDASRCGFMLGGVMWGQEIGWDWLWHHAMWCRNMKWCGVI
jgi:hypothetical protein